MAEILAPADRALALRKAISEIEAETARVPGITAFRHYPALPASYADFPPELSPRLTEVLRRRGIERLYSHQLEAFERVQAGENVVVVTPTASGKTLCYNLPVLDAVLRNPEIVPFSDQGSFPRSVGRAPFHDRGVGRRHPHLHL